jgi:hypothetical protein
MLVHIIADCGPAGDLAFAEVVQRIRLHLPDAEPILTPVPPFATRAFLSIFAVLCLGVLVARTMDGDQLDELAVREVVFNMASILTTTGYASADYTLWGSLAVALIFCAGMIGGCSGSTQAAPRSSGIRFWSPWSLRKSGGSPARTRWRSNIIRAA